MEPPGKPLSTGSEREIDTDVLVVGGGPAGMMLGLLLARQGVRVTVLEKHGDFLRDFRGDTVHPSTLDVLDELGLGGALEEVPHRDVSVLRVTFADGSFTVEPRSLVVLRNPRETPPLAAGTSTATSTRS